MFRRLPMFPVLLLAVGLALAGCEFSLAKLGGSAPATTAVANQAPPVGGDALKKAAADLNDEATQVFTDLTAAVKDGRITAAQFPAIRAAKIDVDRALDEAGQKARDAAKTEEEARGAQSNAASKLSKLRAIKAATPPDGAAAPTGPPTPITPSLPK